MKNKIVTNILIFILLFIVIFAIYGKLLKAPLLYDDDQLIIQNPLVKSLNNIPLFFKTDLFAHRAGERKSNSYRPMQSLLNAWDYLCWGKYPVGYHLTNILLHLINVFIVFLFVRRISEDSLASFLTAFIYAVHPVNTQSVSFVAGRADILMTAFMMLSLLCYIKYKKDNNIIPFALSLFFFFLSLLSREAGLLVLPILIICYLFYFKPSRVFPIKDIASYIGVGLIYLLMRSYALPGEASRVGLEHIPLHQRLAVSIKCLFISLKILFFPHDIHFSRSVRIDASILSPLPLFSLIALVCAVLIIRRLYKKGMVGGHKKELLFSFGLLWYFVSMVPYLNIVPLQCFVSDNWLYQPSIGILFCLSLWIAAVFRRFKMKRQHWGSILILLAYIWLIVTYSGITYKRNDDYSDPIKLYRKNLSYESNVKFYYMLGTEYGTKEEYRLAIDAFEKAIETHKTKPNLFVFNARYNLGVTYYKLGQREKALEQLRYLLDLKDVPEDVKIKWRKKATETIQELTGK